MRGILKRCTMVSLRTQVVNCVTEAFMVEHRNQRLHRVVANLIRGNLILKQAARGNC